MLLVHKITAESVQEREFFLSALEDPLVINGIRIVCVILLVFFVGSYLKYRKKR